jgi:hypothetical protein
MPFLVATHAKSPGRQRLMAMRGGLVNYAPDPAADDDAGIAAYGVFRRIRLVENGSAI